MAFRRPQGYSDDGYGNYNGRTHGMNQYGHGFDDQPPTNFNTGSYRRMYQSSNDRRKKSGATVSPVTKGKRAGTSVVRGWRSTRNGLIVYTCWDQQIYGTTKDGKEWKKYLVEVENKDLGTKTLHTGFQSKDHVRVRVPDLNIVINPHAPNGGYCGISVSRRTKRTR